MSPSSSTTPPWRGIHHIALVTEDLDATADFYGIVLGMSVGDIWTIGTTHARHCFIKPGDTASWGLHVFEYPEAEVHPYPGGLGPGFIPVLCNTLPLPCRARQTGWPCASACWLTGSRSRPSTPSAPSRTCSFLIIMR